MAYQMIDSTPLAHQEVYDLIDHYFDSPQMQKMKNDGDMSVYMTRIATLLASPEQRYLVVVAPIDTRAIGTRVPLSDLKWQSLQTRSLTNVDHTIHRHSYQPKLTKQYAIRMKLIQRFPNRTEYDFNTESRLHHVCTMSLIHTNPNQPLEFPESVILSGSLELYRTVLFIQKCA